MSLAILNEWFDGAAESEAVADYKGAIKDRIIKFAIGNAFGPITMKVAGILDELAMEKRRANEAMGSRIKRDFFVDIRSGISEAKKQINLQDDFWLQDILKLDPVEARPGLLALAVNSQREYENTSEANVTLGLAEMFLARASKNSRFNIYVNDKYDFYRAEIVGPNGEKIAEKIRRDFSKSDTGIDLYSRSLIEKRIFLQNPDEDYPTGVVVVKGNSMRLRRFQHSNLLRERIVKEGLPKLRNIDELSGRELEPLEDR